CAVAKIETADGDRMRRDPGGEGSSLSLFSLINGAKDSVAIDIRVPQAAELLLAGLRRADVLLLDMAAWRTLEPALGKTTELKDRFPALTVCVCSHFGLDSPRADWIGREEIAQAMSGGMPPTGHPGA